MACDHELRLHAEGGEGDRGSADADGHEEVLAFAELRQEGAVGDVPRFDRLADVALHVDLIFGGREKEGAHGDPLDFADVDVVAGHADRVVLAAVGHKVVLGEDVFSLHLAGFADVELVRPAAGVGELVLA